MNIFKSASSIQVLIHEPENASYLLHCSGNILSNGETYLSIERRGVSIMERISRIFILLAAPFLESGGITFSAALALLALSWYYLTEATLTPMVQQEGE